MDMMHSFLVAFKGMMDFTLVFLPAQSNALFLNIA